MPFAAEIHSRGIQRSGFFCAGIWGKWRGTVWPSFSHASFSFAAMSSSIYNVRPSFFPRPISPCPPVHDGGGSDEQLRLILFLFFSIELCSQQVLPRLFPWLQQFQSPSRHSRTHISVPSASTKSWTPFGVSLSSSLKI